MRRIPLDRIRGVDVSAPFLHRLLGSRQGGGGGRLRRRLQRGDLARRRLARAGRDAADGLAPAGTGRPTTGPAILDRASPLLLALGGITSMRYLLAPIAIVGVVANLADDLPGGILERAGNTAVDHAPSNPLGNRRHRRRRHRTRPLDRRGGVAARRLGLHADRRGRATDSRPRSAHATRRDDRPRADPGYRCSRHALPASAWARLGHRHRRRTARAHRWDDAGADPARPRRTHGLLRAVDPPAPDPAAPLSRASAPGARATLARGLLLCRCCC